MSNTKRRKDKRPYRKLDAADEQAIETTATSTQGKDTSPPTDGNGNPPETPPSQQPEPEKDEEGKLEELREKADQLHDKIWHYIGAFLIIQMATILIAGQGNGGKLLMLGIEVLMVGAIFYHATKPIIIGIIIAAAAAIAGLDPKTLTDQRIAQFAGGFYRGVTSVLAYAIALPAAAMVIFDPSVAPGYALAMLFLGILLGVATVPLKNGSELALKISQAALIGSIVKMMLVLIPSEAGIVGNTLAEYSTWIGIVTFFAVLLGWNTVTAGPKTIWEKTWGLVAWIANPKHLFGMILTLALLAALLAAFSYFFYRPWWVKYQSWQKGNNEQAEVEAIRSGVKTPDSSDAETIVAEKAKEAGPIVKTIRPSKGFAGWKKIDTQSCEPKWEVDQGWCQTTRSYPPGKYKVVFTKSTLRRDYPDGSWDHFGMEGIPIGKYKEAGEAKNSPSLLAYYNNLASYLPTPSIGNGAPLVRIEGKYLISETEFITNKDAHFFLGVNNVPEKGFWSGMNGIEVAEIYVAK
jgi:hypothetical protein